MTGFLNRLSGFAVRSPAPGAARISLPPRFAPGPAMPVQERGVEQANPIAAMNPLSESSAESGFDRTPRKEPDSILSGARPGTSQPGAEGTATTSDVSISGRNRRPARESAAPMMPNATASMSDALAELRVAREALLGAAAMPRVGPGSHLALRPQPPALAPTAVSVPQQQDIRAPLAADVLASRPQPSRNDPPVYVTIDRIDVRVAPPAKPAAAQPRPRRAASLSLSDYLRGSGREGRT